MWCRGSRASLKAVDLYICQDMEIPCAGKVKNGVTGRVW
nr:MAG TPA: hypothetical protein [Caudoviricetes sp.]